MKVMLAMDTNLGIYPGIVSVLIHGDCEEATAYNMTKNTIWQKYNMTKKYNMTESDKIQVRIWTPTWKADRA